MRVAVALQRSITVLVFLGVLLPAALFADEAQDAINERIKALEQEAAQTTDLNRLMEIAKELGELAGKIAPGPGLPAATPQGRGRTPDEQVNREIDAMNSSYERQKRGIVGYRDANAPLIPFMSARKLHGGIEVRGSNQRLPSETPYNGGVSRTLQYTIKEDFVGYLLTTEFYDPRTGRFTDKKEYALRTISERIHPPAFGGKECVETDGPDWRICKKWEPYALFSISKDDQYPSLHEWTIIGSPEDDGILFKVETPDILFITAKKNKSRGQGCFGAEIYMSNVDLEADMEDNRVIAQQSVGGDFKGTPHCGRGSNVEMHLVLCPEVPRCQQLEDLVDNVLWAIGLRDGFLAKSQTASSEEQLVQSVGVDLAARYPGLDIQDKQYLEDNAGGYNFHTGETTLPNLCRGCTSRPLCRWDMEGLRIHEKTHELDVLANPVLRKIFVDTQYQMENYNANELAREQARVRGEMEYHAYDEQARYLMDILKQELSTSTCTFPAGFYEKYSRAQDALK